MKSLASLLLFVACAVGAFYAHAEGLKAASTALIIGAILAFADTVTD